MEQTKSRRDVHEEKGYDIHEEVLFNLFIEKVKNKMSVES
jgi:hypothetical protein